MSAQVTIVHRPNSVKVTTYVDGFDWRCWECGWRGEDLTSPEAAIKEAGRHWDEKHPAHSPPEVEMLASLSVGASQEDRK